MRNAAQESPAYLDASSSERLHPLARETLLAALDQGYADPRRLHREGRNARLLLDNARAVVADCLGVRSDEVSFTSSGTDAVHRGLAGLMRGHGSGPVGAVYSAVEHSAVRHTIDWAIDTYGGESLVASVDSDARVDPADVAARAARLSGGAVVAVQTANHEVGTLQPVAQIAAILPTDRPAYPLFVDARASMGRLPLPADWSALAGSAHLWGGPAGVGVLLVRKRARWHNPFPPDDRSDERVSGFENIPGALAAAASLQAVVAEREEVNARQFEMIDQIRATAASIPDVDVVGDPIERLPHLVTFSALYLNGEALVTALDRRGFSVDSGSACTASTLEPSHVLAAMGALTHGNLRVSLTREVTRADVDRFCDALPEVIAECRKDLDL